MLLQIAVEPQPVLPALWKIDVGINFDVRRAARELLNQLVWVNFCFPAEPNCNVRKSCIVCAREDVLIVLLLTECSIYDVYIYIY